MRIAFSKTTNEWWSDNTGFNCRQRISLCRQALLSRRINYIDPIIKRLKALWITTAYYTQI